MTGLGGAPSIARAPEAAPAAVKAPFADGRPGYAIGDG